MNNNNNNSNNNSNNNNNNNDEHRCICVGNESLRGIYCIPFLSI